MAAIWDAKAATAVAERTWLVPVPDGDSLASVATSATGVTVDSDEAEDNTAVIILSAGVAGTPGSITITATTTDGLVFVETFSIAIRDTAPTAGDTVQDVCTFAMRKIAGMGESAEADEMEVALELLNDMLAEWRIDGLDIGTSGVLALSDVLTIPDEYLSAVKYSLTVLIAEEFDRELSQTVVSKAERGKVLLANRLIAFDGLSFEGPLTHSFVGRIQ